MNYKGFIFDMDGTLVDNGQYHVLAWQEFAKRHGRTVDRLSRAGADAVISSYADVILI